MKRVYVEVRWSDDLLWHVVRRDSQGVIRWNGMDLKWFPVKSRAIKMARDYCKLHMPSELVQYNKDGKISKGDHGRSTFGADPKKTKG